MNTNSNTEKNGLSAIWNKVISRNLAVVTSGVGGSTYIEAKKEERRDFAKYGERKDYRMVKVSVELNSKFLL